MNKIITFLVIFISIVASQNQPYRLGQNWNEDTFETNQNGVPDFASNLAYHGLIVDEANDFWATYTIYKDDLSKSYIWMPDNQTCVLSPSDGSSEIDFNPSTNTTTILMDVSEPSFAQRCDFFGDDWNKTNVTFTSGDPNSNFTYGSNFTFSLSPPAQNWVYIEDSQQFQRGYDDVISQTTNSFFKLFQSSFISPQEVYQLALEAQEPQPLYQVYEGRIEGTTAQEISDELMGEMLKAFTSIAKKFDIEDEVEQLKLFVKGNYSDLYQGTNEEWLTKMKVGNTTSRQPLIAELIDYVTLKLFSLFGSEYVSTMSDASVQMLSNLMIFWAEEKTFDTYNSAQWSYKKKVSEPSNAIKCAAERGKCACQMGSTVYFGAESGNGGLDTAQGYTESIADFTGSTSCLSSILGDALPSVFQDTKYCFCDELNHDIHLDALKCSDQNELCQCNAGLQVTFSAAKRAISGDANSNTIINEEQQLWNIKSNGEAVNCTRQSFGLGDEQSIQTNQSDLSIEGDSYSYSDSDSYGNYTGYGGYDSYYGENQDEYDYEEEDDYDYEEEDDYDQSMLEDWTGVACYVEDWTGEDLSQEDRDQLNNYACFCQQQPLFDSFCSSNGVEQYVGCLEDHPTDPDFEEYLGNYNEKPQDCLDKAFEMRYLFVGIQQGGQCWGSNRMVGKHGKSHDCNYKCKNFEECGGYHANSVYKMAFIKDQICGPDFNQFLEMENVVGYVNEQQRQETQELARIAQPTLKSMDGNGNKFSISFQDQDQCTLTASRRADGKIKGFVVDQDCKYYETWKYAEMKLNQSDHYIGLQSLPSSIEDWTFVSEHGQWGEIRNDDKIYEEFEGFKMFMFNPLHPTYHGQWFTADPEKRKFQFYDTKGNYCAAQLVLEGQQMILSNPFGQCSFVGKSLSICLELTLQNDILYEIEFDNQTHKFYFSEEELEQAMINVQFRFYSGTSFDKGTYTAYLAPDDFGSREEQQIILNNRVEDFSTFYATMSSQRSRNFQTWTYQDSFGVNCILENRYEIGTETEKDQDGFLVKSVEDSSAENTCYSNWTQSVVSSDNVGKFMTGPFQQNLYVTPLSILDPIIERGEELLGSLENVGRVRCELEGCDSCKINAQSNTTYCTKCDSRFELISGVCQNCDIYDSQCIECKLNDVGQNSESTTCTGCNDGYRLEQFTKQCVPCSSDGICKTCNEDTCFSCFEGTLLNDFGECKACNQTLPYCNMCSMDYERGEPVCSECNDNIAALQDGQCSVCKNNWTPYYRLDQIKCECVDTEFNQMFVDVKNNYECSSCYELMDGCGNCEQVYDPLNQYNIEIGYEADLDYSSKQGEYLVCTESALEDKIQDVATGEFKYCNEIIPGCIDCNDLGTSCDVCEFEFTKVNFGGANQCESCKIKYTEQCQVCNNEECLQCQDGYMILFGLCWKSLW